MSRTKRLRDITPDDLSEAFRRATVKAAQAALDDGLTITGLSPTGKLVTISTPVPSAASATETEPTSSID